jgi:uracil-DNA glycosylase
MDNLLANINPGWKQFFDNNMNQLEDIMNKVKISNKDIFPNEEYIFRTLFYFPPEETKLVILGQDPYIGYEMIDGVKVPQACGLSFSVPKKHKLIPPSLKNIFKEIKNCYPEYIVPDNGSLLKWIKKEKILLLNSSLTVKEGESNSHQHLWQSFTDKLIQYIDMRSEHCVFLLMGNHAINKSKLINCEKHKIFTTVHPSPLSASRGFFGCMVFKNINDYFQIKKINLINW